MEYWQIAPAGGDGNQSILLAANTSLHSDWLLDQGTPPFCPYPTPDSRMGSTSCTRGAGIAVISTGTGPGGHGCSSACRGRPGGLFGHPSDPSRWGGPWPAAGSCSSRCLKKTRPRRTERHTARARAAEATGAQPRSALISCWVALRIIFCPGQDRRAPPPEARGGSRHGGWRRPTTRSRDPRSQPGLLCLAKPVVHGGA